MSRACARLLAPLTLISALMLFAAPPPAQAFDPTKPICTLAGLVSGLAGKVCSAARHAGTVLKAGQKLLGGHLGGAVETLGGGGARAAKAITATAALAAMAVWVIGGARLVLHETASVISRTTSPQLQSTWFSASYWRMAGISGLLTLPFLFAAAIQALLRSDLGLLARSAFGYLPLGLLSVSIAAPVTQLLLSASDELSGLVASASGFTADGFVHVAGLGIGMGAIATFPVFFAGLLAVAATMTLWVELLIRAAAVYVIVLMLPLFFAALVWPARRIWAVRAVELLLALILSKFAIVAVLALGGAALEHSAVSSVTQMLAGTTLVMLAAFTPWALLRLLPLHELAAGVEGLRGAGARGFAPAGGGAEDAYQRSEAREDDLAEPRVRARGDAGQQDAARSAVAGLGAPNAGAAGGTEDERPRVAQTEPEPSPAVAADAPEPPPPPSAVDRDAGQSPRSDRAERIPGMDRPWQSPNLSWPTTELGPDALPEGPIGADPRRGPEPEPPAADPPPPRLDARPGPPDSSREAGLDPWPESAERGTPDER